MDEFFFKKVHNNNDNITKKLFLKVNNSISTLRDMINLFAFIYNKNITLFDLENITQSENFLIILPFIAIKGTIDNYEFAYY